MEILIIWSIYVVVIITLKTSQNQLWVKLVAGTKEDTNWPHCVPEERQRSHARTSKQGPRANLQLLDQTGDGGGDRDVAKIAQRGRRQTSEWTGPVVCDQNQKTVHQISRQSPRNGRDGGWSQAAWQPLYSLFCILTSGKPPRVLISIHHITTSTPKRRKVGYVACLDHYGLWMGSSFDAPSNRHFSLFILGQKYHSWMVIFALAPPRVWFCNKHSTCTLASPSLNCSWWRPPWTPLHPLHPN